MVDGVAQMLPKLSVCFQIVRNRATLCVQGQGHHEPQRWGQKLKGGRSPSFLRRDLLLRCRRIIRAHQRILDLTVIQHAIGTGMLW